MLERFQHHRRRNFRKPWKGPQNNEVELIDPYAPKDQFQCWDHMKMTRHATQIAVLFCIGLACGCTSLHHGADGKDTAPERLNVQVPPGLVAATDAQRKLVANAQTLSRGMSLPDAKRHLGAPTQETSDSLFYHLIECRVFGGYYVTARLKFDDGGLADVKLRFGHEWRTLRIEE